jgi:hypothetical protein
MRSLSEHPTTPYDPITTIRDYLGSLPTDARRTIATDIKRAIDDSVNEMNAEPGRVPNLHYLYWLPGVCIGLAIIALAWAIGYFNL